MAKNKSGRRGRGLIGFFLGFIFAIIAEVVVIAAGIYWLYKSDLSTVLDTVGIDNTQQDETTGETKYVYINTSEITTVADLISQLRTIAGKGSSATLSDLGSFPIVESLVDSIYSSIAGALSMTDEEVRDFIDEDELYSTPLNGLMNFCVECLKDLELSTLLQMSETFEWNDLYLALAYGAEAGTVTYNNSVYVVYYDTYLYDEATGAYTRSSDGTALSDGYEAYLYADTDDYKLYFAIIDGNAYIVERTDDGYSLVGDTSSQTAASISLASAELSALTVYGSYAADACTISGDYYYDADGEVVGINARTLRQIMDDGLDSAFDNIYVSSFISDTEENQAYIKALEGLTLADLMNDGADFADLLSTLTVEDVLGKVNIGSVGEETSSGKILAYLTYGISGLELYDDTAEDGSKIYVAVYHTYTVEEETTGTVTAAEELTEGETEEEEEEPDPFVDYDGYYVYVYVNADGEITGVYTDLTCETQITSTVIDKASDRIDGIMDDLTIGELIDTTGSTVLAALADSTINSLSDDFSTLAIQEVFYEDIYAQTAAYGDEDTLVAAYEYEQYYKVVYESVKSLNGTFYLYTVSTAVTEGVEGSTVTTSIETYSTFTDEQIAAYINGKNNGSTTDSSTPAVTTTKKYTIYWQSSEGGALYEVVMFSSGYLYYSEIGGGYVEYYTQTVKTTDENGAEIEVTEVVKGHVDSYESYVNAGNTGILYTYGKAQSAWYFMLYSDDYECVYSVDDISTLMDNATNNIENSTLYELVETGMLTSSYVQANLDTEVKASILYTIYSTNDDKEKADYYKDKAGNDGTGDGTVMLGDLPLTETMDLLIYMLVNGFTAQTGGGN